MPNFLNTFNPQNDAVGLGQAPTNLPLQGSGALPSDTPFNLPRLTPQPTALPKASLLDDMIQSNFLLIKQKLSKKMRAGQHEVRVRDYSVLASQGRIDPQEAIARVNTEFPEQQELTNRTISNLFYK